MQKEKRGRTETEKRRSFKNWTGSANSTSLIENRTLSGQVVINNRK